MEELQRKHPSVEFIIASYADGAKALKIRNIPCIDLGLPPMGLAHERMVRIGKLLQRERPDLVVADEELFALPLCRVFDIPSIFVTNWLASEDVVSNVSLLLCAEKVLVADLEDAFIAPLWLEEKTVFVGPICRLEAEEERPSAKQELGLDAKRKVVLITAGGSDVSDVVYFGICAYALSSLSVPLQVIAVAGPWYKILKPMEYAWLTSVQFTDYLPNLTRYIAASDLAFTRGGHTTLWEVALHGVPSICIPHPKFVDPLNEHYAYSMQRRGVCIVFPERAANPEVIKAKVEEILQSGTIRDSVRQAGMRLRERVGTRRATEIIGAFLTG
jgi:UDP-N-acetylglucosamine:LPS N-acetylglucosamine transferase